ncbi:MAG: hypothetical protein WAM21_08365, partial [Steroidobacteraceae bacterium]
MGIGARPLLLALALTAPALCLGQEASSTGEGASAPASNTPAVTNAPGAAAPVAILPGISLPGAAVPIEGLIGLTSLPANYTNYDVSAGLGESDNINLSATHPKAQTLAAVNTFFDLIRSGSH